VTACLCFAHASDIETADAIDARERRRLSAILGITQEPHAHRALSSWRLLASRGVCGAGQAVLVKLRVSAHRCHRCLIALWLALTGFNMWVGVTKAGYSTAEELPVLLLLFGVPAVVAIILKWKFI
jgi:hypothetical protein